MTLGVQVVGGGKLNPALVSKRGQLIVAPLDFSQFYTATTTVANTPVNVVVPITGKCFVITAIIFGGNRDIGANGAVTDLYEAESDSSATITRQIIQEEIAKQSKLPLTPINVTVAAGRWVNVKSDDVQVRINIAGYYIDDLP